MVGLKLNHAETGLQGPVESCHYVIEGIKTARSQRNHGSCLSVKTVCPGMKITITNKRRSPRRGAFIYDGNPYAIKYDLIWALR